MKVRKRYTFTLEDESRLEKLLQISASRGKYIICGVAVLIIFMTLGAPTVGLSPARRLLPGYLKDSERAATQEHHMRLDSLQQAYEANNAYLSNIIAVMNPTTRPTRTLPDSAVSQIDTPFSPDSLFPTSVEERNFLSMMREQEKYNISVIAPLAAESMLFAPVNDESIISEKSKKSKKAEVILAKGSQVAAIADGRVIAVSQSVREGGGAAVIIQHAKGFLSRCSRLGTILVEPGDFVSGGQIIAITTSGNSRNNQRINIEMWHNGNELVPYDYLGDKNTKSPRYPIIDEEVGRGRL